MCVESKCGEQCLCLNFGYNTTQCTIHFDETRSMAHYIIVTKLMSLKFMSNDNSSNILFIHAKREFK